MAIQVPFSYDPCDNDDHLDYIVTGDTCEVDSIQALLLGPGPGIYNVYFAHREIGPVPEGDSWIELTCDEPEVCVPDFVVTAARILDK